jgi:hypothetical protein
MDPSLSWVSPSTSTVSFRCSVSCLRIFHGLSASNLKHAPEHSITTLLCPRLDSHTCLRSTWCTHSQGEDCQARRVAGCFTWLCSLPLLDRRHVAHSAIQGRDLLTSKAFHPSVFVDLEFREREERRVLVRFHALGRTLYLQIDCLLSASPISSIQDPNYDVTASRMLYLQFEKYAGIDIGFHLISLRIS